MPCTGIEEQERALQHIGGQVRSSRSNHNRLAAIIRENANDLLAR
jgi:hypothetical protein